MDWLLAHLELVGDLTQHCDGERKILWHDIGCQVARATMLGPSQDIYGVLRR